MVPFNHDPALDTYTSIEVQLSFCSRSKIENDFKLAVMSTVQFLLEISLDFSCEKTTARRTLCPRPYCPRPYLCNYDFRSFAAAINWALGPRPPPSTIGIPLSTRSPWLLYLSHHYRSTSEKMLPLYCLISIQGTQRGLTRI